MSNLGLGPASLLCVRVSLPWVSVTHPREVLSSCGFVRGGGGCPKGVDRGLSYIRGRLSGDSVPPTDCLISSYYEGCAIGLYL